MPQSWRYARVEYSPAEAEMVNAKLAGWAAMGGVGPDKGPGFTQAEAVQFATDLAVLRHSAAMGVTHGRFALYDDAGGFYGTTLQGVGFQPEPGYQAIPIVGDEPEPPAGWSSPYNPQLDPTPKWPRQLVLAIDNVTRAVAKSEQGANVPPGYAIDPIPVPGEGEATLTAWPPLGVAAVIVGGGAAAIMVGVAAWRFLDPDVRVAAARIRAAAKSYSQRLEVFRATGEMPSPSPMETANAEAVTEAAKDQGNRYWLYGAAALGGIGVGVIAISALQRRA